MVSTGQAVPEKLRPYIHHGVQIEPPKSGNEARGTCPFCDKEDHFYVNIHTGLWSCKRCGTGSGKGGGNVFTFLNELFTQSLTATTATDWKELSVDRGLPIPFLKRWDLAKHCVNGKWIVAGRNASGALVNLYTREATGLFSTPTCSLTIIGLHKLTDKQKRVWINEGIWDAIAWDYVLSTLGKKRGIDAPFAITNEAASLRVTNGVVAAPGCSNFKEEWGSVFADREVGILFDNDYPKKHPKTQRITQPGWDGVQRAGQIVAPFADGTEILKWGKPGYDKRLSDGFDIRDLVIRDKPVKAYTHIMAHLEAVKATKRDSPTTESKPLEGLPRHSFQEVLADFEHVLHVTPTLRDCIAITFASVISTNLGGDQLWLRVIGPPGSGKTTLAEAISAAREFTMPRSLITGFHSGYIGEGRQASRKKDAALIPKMNGKTVIIKDADTIVSSGHRDRILSELRDIYDGVSRSEYRNRKSNIYDNLRITFILCGTDRLRSLNRTFLGERFLDVEIIAGEDHKPFLQRSLSNAYQSIVDTMAKPVADDECCDRPPEAMDLIKRGTIGFLTHKREALADHQPPRLEEAEGNQIMALAQFLSYMRARLESNHEELGHRPRAELATRLVAQLTKMAMVLAIVLDRPVVDAEVMRLVMKVVLDTAVGFQLEINLLLSRQGPLASQQLSAVLGISDTHIRTLVKQMQELGIVRRLNRTNNSGIRGRDTHVWQLTPLLEQLINDSGLVAPKAPVATNNPGIQPGLPASRSTNGHTAKPPLVDAAKVGSRSKRAKKPTRIVATRHPAGKTLNSIPY